MPLDPAEVRRHLDAAINAEDNSGRGKAYEALAVYLFSEVPGCIVEPNVTNVFRTEQIDVAVGNARLPNGLPLLPRIILAECKDWDKPVDSATVGYFINILRARRVELGVLIAANGITGDPDDMTNAHALGLAAAPAGVKVAVVTTEEIAALQSTADVVQLLSRRYLRAIATGTIGVP
jgi:hypothetical protein